MPNTLRDKFIDEILRIEGGYTDDPNDSGGKTNFGITEAEARANGFTGHIKHMSESFARGVYRTKYWDTIRGDGLCALSEVVCEEVMDTGVNMGVGRSSGFLQRSLNALNKNGTLYNDLIVDYNIGCKTILALESYLSYREEGVLVKMLNCLQGAAYVKISERREKDERFIYGWFKNRIGM